MKPFASDRQRLSLKALTAPPAGDPLTARLGATGGVAHQHRDATPGAPAPQVETIKQGDKIVRLVVTCSCGERIEIDCLYPAGG